MNIPIVHGLVNHCGVAVGDEAESSRFPRLSIFHDDAVCEFAPLTVKLPQSLIGRLVVETADEKLAKLLRFFLWVFHVFFHDSICAKKFGDEKAG